MDTTNSRAIENIIDYFKDNLIGMKAFSFKLWKKAWKKKHDLKKMLKIQKISNKIESKLKYPFDLSKRNFSSLNSSTLIIKPDDVKLLKNYTVPY